MRITIDLDQNQCIVKKEPSDKRLKRPGWHGSDADSTFWYHVHKALQAQGHDVIRKRMHKDGHLFGSESTQYIRTRSQKNGFMIFDANYALRFAFEEFNKEGKVTLMIQPYEQTK